MTSIFCIGGDPFNEVLQFLRHTVPREAESVRVSLGRFHECHQAEQQEMELQKGVVLRLQSDVALAMEKQWDSRELELEMVRAPR